MSAVSDKYRVHTPYLDFIRKRQFMSCLISVTFRGDHQQHHHSTQQQAWSSHSRVSEPHEADYHHLPQRAVGDRYTSEGGPDYSPEHERLLIQVY